MHEQSRRILIDGRMAGDVGGGFTYLANIVPRLAAFAPDHRFKLLLRCERLARALPPMDNVDLDVLPLGNPARRILFTFADAPRLARAWDADLYFSVSEYAPPRAHCPVIASFRNPNVSTPLKQGWPLKQRVRLATLRSLARLSARTCERIMFVSRDSADWIGDVFGIPERRRAVVRHGIDEQAWQVPATRSPHHRPFILSVSTIYRYKNFVRLIEAYAELASRRPLLPDLLIVGDDQDPDYSRKMEAARQASGLADRIHIVGEVPYADIKSYYQAAELFVFPSYLETFGHPLLEAMASDTPVVASDIGVFREIAGEAAFYADPHRSSSFAAAMEEVLFKLDARETLVKSGRRRLREFSWDQTTRELLSLFEGVVEEERARASTRRPPVSQPAGLPVVASSSGS